MISEPKFMLAEARPVYIFPICCGIVCVQRAACAGECCELHIRLGLVIMVLELSIPPNANCFRDGSLNE